MPFELTHLAVGEQVASRINVPLTPNLLAGTVYPDIRYPAQIKRKLTHTMDKLLPLNNDDFSLGVWLHLATDTAWDSLYLGEQISKPDSIVDSEVVGMLKLVHDRVVYPQIMNTKLFASMLQQAQLPRGLPISANQWSAWISALIIYLTEGPTFSGWKNIIVSMGFMEPQATDIRLKQVEMILPKYKQIVLDKHQELIEEVANASRKIGLSRLE